MRFARMEGVRDDPGFGSWSALLGSCLASIVWSLADYYIAGRVACQLIGALRHPGATTPTVALERFCDHKVTVKALVRVCVRSRVRGHALLELRCSTPCGLVYSMW